MPMVDRQSCNGPTHSSADIGRSAGPLAQGEAVEIRRWLVPVGSMPVRLMAGPPSSNARANKLPFAVLTKPKSAERALTAWARTPQKVADRDSPVSRISDESRTALTFLRSGDCKAASEQ